MGQSTFERECVYGYSDVLEQVSLHVADDDGTSAGLKMMSTACLLIYSKRQRHPFTTNIYENYHMGRPWPSICTRWNRAYYRVWKDVTVLLLVTPQDYVDYFVTLIPKENIPAGVPVHTLSHPRPHPHPDRQCVSPCIRKIDPHRQKKMRYCPTYHTSWLSLRPQSAVQPRILQIVDTSRQIRAGNNTKITWTWGRGRWRRASSTCYSSYNKKEEETPVVGTSRCEEAVTTWNLPSSCKRAWTMRGD